MSNLNLQFIKANPSGNTTVFVLTPLPREQYTRVTALLMKDEVLAAEQVGFVEKTASGSFLQMMGGEFCGNASRSYAAWLMMGGREWLEQGGELLQPLGQAQAILQVQVSGHHSPLSVRLEDIGCPFGCLAEIEMPLHQRISHGEDAELGPYSLVEFAGISHGVIWERQAAENLLPRFRHLLRRHNLDDTCCGLIFVENQQPLTIRPLVYVGEVGSLVWENSCGSGSLALACALADKNQRGYNRLQVHQPGGVLQLNCSYSAAGISGAYLSGEVYFTAQGLAHIAFEE